MLNIIGDVTKECFAAVADTSLSGTRLVCKLEALIFRRGMPAAGPGNAGDLGAADSNAHPSGTKAAVCGGPGGRRVLTILASFGGLV